MKFLNKYKNFFSDMILNMIGFGIYIVSQQIILLPILNKVVEENIYANIVLYISILNVVCNTTGGELGNVRLVRDSEYKAKNIIGDFTRILVILSPIIAIIVFPLFIYLKYSVIGSLIFTVTILLANIRLYATCFYRLRQTYTKVIIQNILYLVGIVIGLGLFIISRNIYILLFAPELISVFYALKNSDILEMKFAKTKEMFATVKKFFQLGFVSFLTNLMNYFDRFLIYPMFGAAAIAMYYAVNSMAKVTSLITNPMSNVILSWVSNASDQSSKAKILKMTLLANLPVIILVTLLTMPCSYAALWILYHEYIYVKEALILIIPISITTAFGTAAALIKSVLLKYSNTNKLVITYIVYFLVFAVSAYFLSKSNGILGFTIANLISQIVLWILFIILLLTSKENKTVANS